MLPYSIYVIDDEELILTATVLNLGDKYNIKCFSKGSGVINSLKEKQPDLILLDIGLPDINGIELLKEIKKSDPDIIVIMITAYDDIDSVISAMKYGAYDYIIKPINMDSLNVKIENALESIKLRKEVQLLQQRYLTENVPYFIGESNSIQNIMELVDKVAKSRDSNVLIYGETGTGKELIASAIHYKSPNFRGPFITVNCASIPKNLLESELFGYEKGAFSGADPFGKKGLIEISADGTLFLDEIGDLNMESQAKLLRFIEYGEFYKVGGTKKYKIQTRIIAATNKKLESLIAEKLFREDLYFRLSVIKIAIPSLNERKDDIIPIAKHFLVEFSKKFGKNFTGISKSAQEALKSYKWKGNVRELRNIIERGVLLGKCPEITENDFMIDIQTKTEQPINSYSVNFTNPVNKLNLQEKSLDLPALHESIDKYYFKQALKDAQGNSSKACELLNMNYFVFRRRKEKLNIND
ncbi:MAG: sigma-54-dependent Fis family transcriptional regulator [Desulfobacterales bacterium]|nr:sigma-54-dependent Fis family transcriptional regulator [Desulfobacterales bacterium]